MGPACGVTDTPAFGFSWHLLWVPAMTPGDLLLPYLVNSRIKRHWEVGPVLGEIVTVFGNKNQTQRHNMTSRNAV